MEDVRLQMEHCLLQISCKAAAVNLLEKSHCLKKLCQRDLPFVFLGKRACGGRHCSILHSLMSCKEAFIKEDSAFSQSRTRKETWQYSMCCVALAFCIVFCMREKEQRHHSPEADLGCDGFYSLVIVMANYRLLDWHRSGLLVVENICSRLRIGIQLSCRLKMKQCFTIDTNPHSYTECREWTLMELKILMGIMCMSP